MINLPPADRKHIQAQIAAASKQSMHAGTHFTDLGSRDRVNAEIEHFYANKIQKMHDRNFNASQDARH